MNIVARIFFKFDKEVRILFGKPYRLHSIDRKILEQQLLPWFAARQEMTKVLFVGCDAYTVHYQNIFSKQEYWTIEPDVQKAKFGSKNHIVDRLENLEAHLPQNYFDLIVCNGIYGWGLNEKDAIEKAFKACNTCLRNGGYFILGWNDLPDKTPVLLSSIQALQLFSPFSNQFIGGPRIITPTEHRHVFDLYQRK